MNHITLFCLNDQTRSVYSVSFRIQSDDLKAMAVILETILVRIDKLKKPNKEQKAKQAKGSAAPDKIKVTIQPNLQTDQIVSLVMDHFKARQEVQHIRVNLI